MDQTGKMNKNISNLNYIISKHTIINIYQAQYFNFLVICPDNIYKKVDLIACEKEKPQFLKGETIYHIFWPR